MRNVFTVAAAYIHGGVKWKKSSETLNEIIGKYLRNTSLFGRVAGSKNELIHMFFSRILLKVYLTLFNFREDVFCKSKVLLVANVVIYFNISKNRYIKIPDPRPPRGSIHFYIEKILLVKKIDLY